MSKKAVLVVSFGTTHLDTMEKTIAAIEQDIRAAMPERVFHRAFTSSIVRRRLGENSYMQVDSPIEAMEKLADEGYTNLVLQPTHVLSGEEYSKLMHSVHKYGDRLPMAVGKPLLTALEDYCDMCKAIMAVLPEKQADTCHIFMGHGTEHRANPVYTQLEYMFHDMGRDDILIGTVEGYPALEQVERRLMEREGVKNVVLRPLMVVAGDHAKNDLNGDDADSWRSVLTAEGYTVSADLRGLGEYSGIRKLFVEHALAAQAELEQI